MLKRAGVSVLLLAAMACGGANSTPTSPTPTPNFQGQFTGSYVTTGCTETGVFFSGFCNGYGLALVGVTYPLSLSLVQNQTIVTGTLQAPAACSACLPGGVPLGSVSGTFQGLVQPSGHLAATAAMSPFVQFGNTIRRNITAWDTTIAENSLDGSFTLVLDTTAATGTVAVSASLLQVTRQ
jgi:hypothetical protein